MDKKKYQELKCTIKLLVAQDVITASGTKFLGEGDWGCEDDFVMFE